MIREQYNKSSYRVNTANHSYIVTLQRLHNTAAGCPRFEAAIICLDAQLATFCYRFSGHYEGEAAEAENIVRAHEERHHIA